ncbi:hypothetical protein [Micromonospora chersina]
MKLPAVEEFAGELAALGWVSDLLVAGSLAARPETALIMKLTPERRTVTS